MTDIVLQNIDPEGPIEEVRASMIFLIENSFPLGTERSEQIAMLETNEEYVRHVARNMIQEYIKVKYGRKH